MARKTNAARQGRASQSPPMTSGRTAEGDALVKALRDFADSLPYCVHLAGEPEAARKRIVQAADAWLKGAAHA